MADLENQQNDAQQNASPKTSEGSDTPNPPQQDPATTGDGNESGLTPAQSARFSRHHDERPTMARLVIVTNEDGDKYPGVVSAVTANAEGEPSYHVTVFDAVMGPRLYCITGQPEWTRGVATWAWPTRD